MIYGRIVWVGYWQGPFTALPRGHGVYLVTHTSGPLAGEYVLDERGRLIATTGPMPIQPKVEARFRMGVHDGSEEHVHTLNFEGRNTLLKACFGDFTSLNRPAIEECVGFYISGERVQDKNATKTKRRARYEFAVVSAPRSSW